jgi:Tfp pilus assembly protein PilP
MYKFIIILNISLLISGLSGCGDDKKKKKKRKRSSTAPQNIKKVKRNTNVKKAANINFFANKNLSIPPFNISAINIPPEMFSEQGKQQRDPFRNLFDEASIDKNEKPEPANGNLDDSSFIVLMEQYTLSQLKLTGIIWMVGREKAQFIDPKGQPVIVMKDDYISKSKALVKEITHDKVLVELSSGQGGDEKIFEFSLIRKSGPYQIQYTELRSDKRGIRVHLRNSWRRKNNE